MHLIDAKANTKYLEKEREQLLSQIERLNAHLKQHAEEHEQHARSDGEEDTSLKSLAFKNLTKIFDKKPSRKVSGILDFYSIEMIIIFVLGRSKARSCTVA